MTISSGDSTSSRFTMSFKPPPWFVLISLILLSNVNHALFIGEKEREIEAKFKYCKYYRMSPSSTTHDRSAQCRARSVSSTPIEKGKPVRGGGNNIGANIHQRKGLVFSI